MPWVIGYDESTRILTITTSDFYDSTVARQMLGELKHALTHHGAHRVLIDQQKAEIRLTFSDLINRTDLYKAIGIPPSTKTALVFRVIVDDYRFLEDVCVNRGYQLKIFDNFENAVRWLSA